MELIKKVKRQWEHQAVGYSDIVEDELDSFRVEAWTDLIQGQIKTKKILNILDIGCGPGFFSIILSKLGHNVIGIDYSENMLEKVKANAKKHGVNPKFIHMDSHNLEFEDETFDLIISRNVTWNLQDTDKFFKGCRRVLKTGGKMVYFDANWYLFLHDEKVREEKEIADRKYAEIYKKESDHSIKEIALTDVAYKLPMSKVHRPAWDRENLPKYGFKLTRIDENINHRVLNEEEQIKYSSTPMFTVVVTK